MPIPYGATVIPGTLTDTNVNTNVQVRDVTERLFKLFEENEQHPFLSLLSEISFGRSAQNPKHEWFAKDLHPRWDTVSSVTSGAGTATIVFTPTNIDWYREGDEIKFIGISGNMNHAVITAKSTTVTAVSLDGTTTLPSIVAGTQIQLMSFAGSGTSTLPTIKSVKKTNDYNYPQFLRAPTTVDVWQLHMKNYTGMEETERNDEQELAIKIAFEDTMFWGERGYRTASGTTNSGGRQYFMRGLKEYIANDNFGDNDLDWSAGLTRSQWDEFLVDAALKYGSKKKMLFTSSDLLLKIHEFERDSKRIVDNFNGSISGISFLKYLAPNGRELYIHQHQGLDGGYEGTGFIVDLQDLAFLPYGSIKPFEFHEGVQANDSSVKSNEWWIIATMEVGRPEKHAYINVGQ